MLYPLSETRMDDQRLIDKIRQRDQDAMVELHSRYVNLVYSVVYRVLDDGRNAEEAVQDTFMKAWQNASQFDSGRGPLVAWLIGIARNVAIDRLRQLGRQVRVSDDMMGDESDNALTVPDDWMDGERLSSLRFAVNDLPIEQRRIIELSYYGGMSQSEIADQLQLPLGTVKTRMRLGMQKLRAAWLKE